MGLTVNSAAISSSDTATTAIYANDTPAAPRLDPTRVTPIAEANRFLYTGANPVQTVADLAQLALVKNAQTGEGPRVGLRLLEVE